MGWLNGSTNTLESRACTPVLWACSMARRTNIHDQTGWAACCKLACAWRLVPEIGSEGPSRPYSPTTERVSRRTRSEALGSGPVVLVLRRLGLLEASERFWRFRKQLDFKIATSDQVSLASATNPDKSQQVMRTWTPQLPHTSSRKPRLQFTCRRSIHIYSCEQARAQDWAPRKLLRSI